MNDAYYFKSAEPEVSFFKSQGFMDQCDLVGRRDGEELLLEGISPFLRTLLVTDGTVTKSLEAYFWERLEVQTICQDLEAISQDVAWLKLAAGSEVLTREVKLIGVSSERVYAGAYSMINLEAIPDYFSRQLIAGEIGIGVLIRDSGLESYREIVDFGAEKADAVYYGYDSDVGSLDIIYRTYRIFLEGKPAIVITERFPRLVYEC